RAAPPRARSGSVHAPGTLEVARLLREERVVLAVLPELGDVHRDFFVAAREPERRARQLWLRRLAMDLVAGQHERRIVLREQLFGAELRMAGARANARLLVRDAITDQAEHIDAAHARVVRLRAGAADDREIVVAKAARGR